MKKTFLVIYTNAKVADVGYQKRYAFNTSDELNEGDLLKSPQYDTNMQVVKVLDKAYKYFNRVTGKLSDRYSNSNQFEIRDLVLGTPSNVVYATVIK